MAKRILVPLSQHEPAASFAIALGDLARGGGATVRLLHVALPAGTVTDADGRLVAYADQETLRLDAEARDFLETVAMTLEGIPVERAVRFGDPVHEILAEAAEFGADLIAIGVGQRRHFRLRGGVAAQVLRRAEMPVALLRAGQHEARGH